MTLELYRKPRFVVYVFKNGGVCAGMKEKNMNSLPIRTRDWKMPDGNETIKYFKWECKILPSSFNLIFIQLVHFH